MAKKYVLFYKPYGVICQFSPHESHATLASFGFPKNLYPIGRLDTDSEGLLLLTDDGIFQHRLIEPQYAHERTYCVQVERIPSDENLLDLAKGVPVDGQQTRPAKVRLLEEEPSFPERAKPIRFRKNVPTCWLEMILTEGRNRQVKRMTAAIGHPTLRLVRTKILMLTLEGLVPGQWRDLTREELADVKNRLKL